MLMKITKKLIFLVLSFTFLITSLTFASSAQAQKTFYYHSGRLGSPVAITNEGGDIVWKANYEPFGEIINEQGNGDFKYNAKELDEDTGLYYYGARYYESETGRFINADKMSGSLGNPQSLNLYAYTLNNPLKYVDLVGLQPSQATTSVILEGPNIKILVHYGFGGREHGPPHFVTWQKGFSELGSVKIENFETLAGQPMRNPIFKEILKRIPEKIRSRALRAWREGGIPKSEQIIVKIKGGRVRSFLLRGGGRLLSFLPILPILSMTIGALAEEKEMREYAEAAGLTKVGEGTWEEPKVYSGKELIEQGFKGKLGREIHGFEYYKFQWRRGFGGWERVLVPVGCIGKEGKIIPYRI
jgi:RHS repeat-associated protein